MHEFFMSDAFFYFYHGMYDGMIIQTFELNTHQQQWWLAIEISRELRLTFGARDALIN